MSAKTTGAEYKAYIESTDHAWWPPNAYMDDELLTIDGVSFGDESDFDPMKLADNAIVVIESGSYYRNYDDDNPIALETHFKRWKKAQTTTRMVIEIDKTKIDSFKNIIKANGGKVIGS